MESARARDGDGIEVRYEEDLAAESAERSKDRAKPEGFRRQRGSSKNRTGRHQPVVCNAAESSPKWNGGDFLIIRVVHEVGLAGRKLVRVALKGRMVAGKVGKTPGEERSERVLSTRGQPDGRH